MISFFSYNWLQNVTLVKQEEGIDSTYGGLKTNSYTISTENSTLNVTAALDADAIVSLNYKLRQMLNKTSSIIAPDVDTSGLFIMIEPRTGFPLVWHQGSLYAYLIDPNTNLWH